MKRLKQELCVLFILASLVFLMLYGGHLLQQSPFGSYLRDALQRYYEAQALGQYP